MKRKQILIEKYIEPSETKKDGAYVIESWFDKHGDYHSFMGQPAVTCYGKNKKVLAQHWCKKGISHRDRNLPASIYYSIYYNYEHLTRKIWWENGKVKKRIYCLKYQQNITNEK
jgi:hypothetical protein